MGMPETVRQVLAERYTVERELGRGGMGVVYLARDLRHQRAVALKVLLPEFASGSGTERFQREILFAARLQHPHILTVLDSGKVVDEANGVTHLWFTMPFVEGESLRERLDREGRLVLEDALRITTETARALDYAHGQGVIHRDIKPENILLTRDGTTLVTDFGIARAAGAKDRLTQTGAPIGTAAYMSPEATDEVDADARSDQYSLAVVLYEMLAGEPAFTGRSLHAIVAKRLSDQTPSVRSRAPSTPLQVDAAIERAMAPQPAERFGSIGEFAKALAGGPMAGRPDGREASRRRRKLLITAAAAGGLLAAAAWWSLRRPSTPPADHPPVVAVLPFENQGDSADAYFADGVADEIRAKLAQVAGLEVIARGSSIEYRGTTRRPGEIAAELGADYLLTGTVRWDKAAGAGRVRVTPELVDARSGQPARSRWAQQFNASLTDVFEVQADIASKVVDALGMALADSARRELNAPPTANLAAYDEFLKGEAAAQGMKGDQASLRRAIGYYRRAIALDSTFVHAWSQLSRASSSLFSNGVPSPEIGDEARNAAERARRLAPNDPSVYLAIGDYYGSVNPIDNERAAQAYQQGLRLAPGNVDLLGAAAMTESSLGRWGDATTRLARASQLDPRSASAARRLSAVSTFLRNYPAADSAADRAIALAPTSPAIVSLKVLAAVSRGERDSARAVIRRATHLIDSATLYPFIASYQDLYWVLDDDQQREVLAAGPAAFDGDRGVWGMVCAQIYHDRGERRLAAAYADSARIAFAEQLRNAPDDGQRRVLLGLALAYLGRAAEAVREGRRGVELMPISRDGYLGPYVQLQLARIYILTGQPAQALDQLEPLLRMPFYLSPGWLQIDPAFDPLRNNPRFRALIEGTSA